MSALSDAWLSNPWLVWGMGSYIASVVGFLLTATVLEVVIRSSMLDSSLLSYASSKYRARKTVLAETYTRLPFKKQLRGSLKFILGGPTIASTFGLAVAMQALGVTAKTWLPVSTAQAALQLLQMAIMNDFGLYWGHRVQHESKSLWRFHAKHHAIDTPSPFSAVFIHPLDATLQGSLPILLAAVVVRPAPALLYLFIASRLGENVVNHSGLDSTLIDVLTLKVLPFRASIAHHDAHHKYCNHALRATNYAESFWVWDVLFGTAGPIRGHAPAHQPTKLQ